MQRRKRGQVTYTAVWSKEMAALDITRTSPPRSSLRRRLCGMCASKRKPIPSTTGREQYYLFFLYHLTAGFNPSSRRSLHDGIVKLHRSIASAPIPIHWLFIGGLAEHRCESSFVPSSRQSSRETLALCPSNFGAEPIKTPRSSLCRRCSSMF